MSLWLPQTALEIRMAKIWAEVLHLPRVSVTLDLLKAGRGLDPTVPDHRALQPRGAALDRQTVAAAQDGARRGHPVGRRQSGTRRAAQDGRSRLPNLGKFKRGARNASNS